MVPLKVESRITKKMQSRGIDQKCINEFLNMVRRVPNSNSGYIPLAETSPPDSRMIIDSETLGENQNELERLGRKLLTKAVVIKLNGGRSTSMGGLVPKGILEVKNGRCYLEIIVGQIEAIKRKWGAEIPLVLMNSFFTHERTMEILADYNCNPHIFIQNQVPRLLQDSLLPMETDTDDDWAPPGHGDVFISLKRTGILERLIKSGKKWAFISNLDNLAACLEPWILGLISTQNIDFLLEVTDRTSVDRKGGTLVIHNNKLQLLELAQVEPEERDSFMDIERFKVFNTNNLWVDLEALAAALNNQTPALPLIQNHKTIGGLKIIQLESAMGAAIGIFPRARGLRVGRDRFFPTKKIGDLFLLQTDFCILDSMDRIRVNPKRPPDLSVRPSVVFDVNFLDFPHKIPERFEDPSSISLVLADSFEVSGPVFFEKNVRIEGHVAIKVPNGKPYRIYQGSILKNALYPQDLQEIR